MVRLISLFAVVLLSLSCTNSDSDETTFDRVWSIVDETYPDTTYINKHWQQVRDKYKSKYVNAELFDDKISVLNKMVFELGVSHTFVGKLSQIKEKASPYMFKPAWPGFDIRIIDDMVIVTRVSKTNETVQNKLTVGTIINKINGVDVEEIITKTDLFPPFNDRYKSFLQTESVVRELYGEVGDTLFLEIIDAEENIYSYQIELELRQNETILSPELPPIFLEVESSILEDNIGYLRFNAFQPNNPIEILTELGKLMDTDGLVIDLRGNNGGSLEAQRLIANQLVADYVPGIITKSRERTDTIFYEGTTNSYSKPIVIIVDQISVSGAEIFPATLRDCGAAKLVGTQTPGAVMGGTLDFVSDSLAFVHPTLIIESPHGINFEGQGVTPDILVPINYKMIRNGIDNQLRSAIESISNSN